MFRHLSFFSIAGGTQAEFRFRPGFELLSEWSLYIQEFDSVQDCLWGNDSIRTFASNHFARWNSPSFRLFAPIQVAFKQIDGFPMVFPIYTVHAPIYRAFDWFLRFRARRQSLPNHQTVHGNAVFSHSPDPRSDFLHLSEDTAERDPQAMDRLNASSCVST